MFKFIITRNHGNNYKKSLNFIITISSHPGYDNKGDYNPLFKKPQNMAEKHFNALNYIGRSIQYLIPNTEDEAPFIIYGDHKAEDLGFRNTPAIIYNKKKSLFQPSRDIGLSEILSLLPGQFAAQRP